MQPTLFRARQLPHFRAAGRQGIQPPARQALIAFKKAIDRIILFDVFAAELQENDHASKAEPFFKRRTGEQRIIGDHFQLFDLGVFQNLSR